MVERAVGSLQSTWKTSTLHGWAPLRPCHRGCAQGEQSHRRSREGFDRPEDFAELLCTSMCCRLGLEGLQDVVGTGILPLSPGSSLSALQGGGTGEWSGQSRCWRPWESSVCAACPARASPHMPAMTAQLWENLSGLQGLGQAVREGGRAEPRPLLSASAVSPVAGNTEGCWSLRGAGGLLWEQLHVCHPTGPSRPILQRGGGGREAPVSRFRARPTSCVGFSCVIFDLLPLSLQLSSLLLPHCGGWAVSPMTLCV